MFPKTHRFDLRQEKEFFRTAKRKNYPFFHVFFTPSNVSQFAVVVPKKVSTSSAKRHKLLRQMRHILMRHREKFDKKKYVFVLFRSSLGTAYKDLDQAVESVTTQRL